MARPNAHLMTGARYIRGSYLGKRLGSTAGIA